MPKSYHILYQTDESISPRGPIMVDDL